MVGGQVPMVDRLVLVVWARGIRVGTAASEDDRVLEEEDPEEAVLVAAVPLEDRPVLVALVWGS